MWQSVHTREDSMRRSLFALLLALPAISMAAPTQEWTATYDAGGNYVDAATQALTDPAGNLVLGGTSHDGAGGADINVTLYARADGSVIWEARMQAYDHTSDMAIDGLAWDNAGDILMAGRLLGCGTG